MFATKSLSKLFAILIVLFSLIPSAQAYEFCTVTTERDYSDDNDMNMSGYLRYYLEDVLDNDSSRKQCAPEPSGDIDYDDDLFDAVILFETAELLGIEESDSPLDIDFVTLVKPINVASYNYSKPVAIGNWTAAMIGDAEFSYGEYPNITEEGGVAVIDASELEEGIQPFDCGDSGERNVVLRNVILATHNVKEEDLACIQDGGAFYVCESELIPTSEVPADAGTAGSGRSSRSTARQVSPTSFSAVDMITRPLTVAVSDLRPLLVPPTTSSEEVTYEVFNAEWSCKRTKIIEAEDCDDGVDNDGDDLIDSNDPDCQESADDADGDGSDETEDCDDTDPNNFPHNPELCDGDDNDCDGVADDGIDCDDDIDNDGDGQTENDGDCDDADANNYTGNPELCDGADNDCDTVADNGLDCTDADADGYTVSGGDCDDTNGAINPGAAEICDDIDNDCDSTVDDGLDCTDDDGDGYIDDDCDETNAAVNPGATEVCDDVDNDCDGSVDEDLTDCGSGETEVCDGIDNDGDGTVDESFADTDADGKADCVDAETCDGIDNDGDGSIDEDFDDNGDGVTECREFGNENCDDAIDNDVDGLTDCDDDDCDSANVCNDAGLEEICDDGLDDDSDGFIDCEDGDCAAVEACLPKDDDLDGFDTTVDCDDADASINPGASEVCSDSLDNDCDGVTNEYDVCSASGEPEVDDDGDEYCDDVNGDGLCSDGSLSGDCDDSDAAINPGATEGEEECSDDIDQNCDSVDVLCQGTTPIGDGIDLVGGGCGCDLKSNSRFGTTETAQVALTMLPLVFALLLRNKAKKKEHSILS